MIVAQVNSYNVNPSSLEGFYDWHNSVKIGLHQRPTNLDHSSWFARSIYTYPKDEPAYKLWALRERGFEL